MRASHLSASAAMLSTRVCSWGVEGFGLGLRLGFGFEFGFGFGLG